ncbi:MAG: TCP-1/cpn60 chaperonin family protein [Candidatus Aenigmarchaeota archaeon]|nr:TCP-1/cpn60 chaperonin family protein [Candidatus Aenigmarchaeota archaeon]
MNGQQPIFILPEGTIRDIGKSAQKSNIAAAKAIGDTVRTTLGPKGMDKMLVDSIGDVVITNDGVTILDEMEIEHPAAKMMVEVAKTQEETVGDGTTTAVIFAAELLKKAEELLDQNIHPTVITRGYKTAKEKALEILVNKIAKDIDPKKDREMLKKIAITAMTGKSVERTSDHLAEIAVKAVEMIQDGETIDIDDIKLEKKQGGGIEDTELIKGVVIDKEVAHDGMSKKVTDAKIALIDSALEIKETETEAKINISSPEQLEAFLQQEERMIKDMVDKIVKSGANVVFCQKGIDDAALHYLAKNNILAVRRVKKSDMDALAKATGAKITTDLDDLSEDVLGYAETVTEEKISGEKMVFVRGCKSPKSVSILIRGGTEHVVDEVERAIKDAIGGIIAAIQDKKIVVGGGATEIELSKELRSFAQGQPGKEQFAMLAFADALEVVPRTLAENAGLDAIDMLVNLRAAHDQGKTSFGLDVYKGEVADMIELGVIEPLKIKTQAIKSGSEAAEMILRIDDVINAGKLSKGSGESGPGAGGGMPPY